MIEGKGDGDGDGDGKTWRDGLPADLVAAPYFRSADSLEQAIKDITNAADNQGNSLRIPGPDATDAARSEFYQRIVEKAPGVMRTPDLDNQDAISAVLAKLGKPAEANEYSLTAVEGAELSDERTGELKRFAHEAGLTKKQFDAFMGQVLHGDASANAAAKNAFDSQVSELKGEWGAAYDQRMAKVAKVLEMTGARPDLLQSVQDGTLNATDARWLHGMAERMSGDGSPVGAQGKSEPDPVMTPGEALERLGELESNLIGNRDLSHEQRMQMIKRRGELMALARPGDVDDIASLARAMRGFK